MQIDDDPVFAYLKTQFPPNIEVLGGWIEIPKKIEKNRPSKMLYIEVRDKPTQTTSVAPYNYKKLERQFKKQGLI